MRKIALLLAFITAFALSGLAQDPAYRVSGRVEEIGGKKGEAATVSLLTSKDSSLVKMTIANALGEYVFEDIKRGSYLVSVSKVGFRKDFSPVFQLDSLNPMALQPIVLASQAASLGGVTVTSKRPMIEQKIDRTVLNVEASVTNAGASALEVLEKAPGVTVDKDGNISLKGKEGVMVLVDGRPTQLSGADLANMLRNMQSAQLDQIEIMTNPPAKFDAAGNAGIINIKTKKNKQFGYNGTVTLNYGQGKYPKYNEGVNFNYRAGKINLFTNLSHNYRRNWNTLTLQRTLRNRENGMVQNYFDQVSKMQNESNSFSGKIGIDYSPSKNTTIGAVVTGFSNPGTFANRSNTFISSPLKELQQNVKAKADYDQTWKNFSTNLNFRQILDTTGKELTADFDYVSYNSMNDQLLTNEFYDASGHPFRLSDTLIGSLPQQIGIYSGRFDYLQPLKKGARFEAGIKSSYVETDNNANYDTLRNGSLFHDFGRSNHFIYEENINAAYVNFSTPLTKKINVQLGLRAENTNIHGNQVTTGEKFDTSYTQLFPTAYFQYAANEKNNFGLNYGRRIRRPNYESLNPFVKFLDRYTYQQGNPYLRPQFSHNIEVSHTYKNFLTTTLNYTRTNDIIMPVIEQRDTAAFQRQANIAKQRQVGLAVNANHPVTKWWTSSVYVNVNNNRFEGIVDNTPITVSGTTLSLNSTQQVKFAKTWSGEVSGFYRTAGLESVLRTKPVGIVSFGISKQVMKTKGTVRLTVRDAFQTQKFRAVTKYGNVDARFMEVRDTRVVNLGFTYRFNKGKMNGGPKKRTNGSAGEEQNRVGVGSGS